MRLSLLAIAVLMAACNEHGTMLCPVGEDCCRSSDDCSQQFEQCFAPGEDVGCGACQIPPVTCQQDTECTSNGPTFICAAARCSCNGEMTCIAGCADDTACGEGLMCAANHRCVARACSEASPCPADFDCATGACIRRTCTSDGPCDGVCVNGQCFATFGFCSPLPA